MSNAAVPDRPARLATWLIQRAARHAPPSLTPRLEEEWLAVLGAQSGVCARLRFAFGCCWATLVIAHNPVSFAVAAGSIAGGDGAIAAFAQDEVSPFSRRSTIIFAVLCLHLAAISAFMFGVGNSRPVLSPGPMTFTNIKLPIEPLLPPQVRPIAPVTPIVRIPGGPGAGFPRTDDFYPAASIRLGEAGATAIRVCVDSRGRLIGDPTIAESSGNARLDAGALALSRAGSGHYRSTTEDAKPVTSCYAFRVRFQMKG